MQESLWRRVLFLGDPSAKSRVPRVLVITASARDRAFYKSLRERGEWDIVITESVQEALAQVVSQDFPIILCDRDLPGWGWREVVTKIVERTPRSCFLLASRVSDEYLWREVVALGGYDIVAKPLSDSVVIHTLQRAWYFWNTETR